MTTPVVVSASPFDERQMDKLSFEGALTIVTPSTTGVSVAYPPMWMATGATEAVVVIVMGRWKKEGGLRTRVLSESRIESEFLWRDTHQEFLLR